jgi:hypothetical protein
MASMRLRLARAEAPKEEEEEREEGWGEGGGEEEEEGEKKLKNVPYLLDRQHCKEGGGGEWPWSVGWRVEPGRRKGCESGECATEVGSGDSDGAQGAEIGCSGREEEENSVKQGVMR